MNTLGNVSMESATVAQAPNDSAGVVRLGDLTAAIASRAPASHEHAANQINGFQSAVSSAVALLLTPSSSIGIESLEGGLVGIGVRIRPDSGLEETDDGIAVATAGAGAVALQSYVDERIHAPATGDGTSTAEVSVNPDTQAISVTVRVDSAGALEVGESGLKVRLGSGATEAAPGNHSHDGQFQLPIEVSNEGRSVVIEQSGTGNQTLSANVRLDQSTGDGTIPLALSAAGLAIPVGSDGTKAAAGNHSHEVATTEVAGFMSAADKAKLNGIGGQPQPFPFGQEAPLVAGKFLPGFYTRLSDTTLKRITVAMDAPLAAPIVLRAYVGPSIASQNGTAVTVTIPLGSSGTTSFVTQTADLNLAAGDVLRLKVESGTGGGGDSGHCAALIFTT